MVDDRGQELSDPGAQGLRLDHCCSDTRCSVELECEKGCHCGKPEGERDQQDAPNSAIQHGWRLIHASGQVTARKGCGLSAVKVHHIFAPIAMRPLSRKAQRAFLESLLKIG